ncbi:heme NO-binding domain-containing protein [Vogesella sp. XCS3]|uniref:heme NO-binding domain-containing protein n=1 Tax=Vogesella sp. XCS3 TaxID=2877939 RepID=UPI001D0A188E|nr:heme NO-binding domain-containing protein [Vogesella sp. XCS3]UDM16336.1 heme NO-binding domain-containing protein [Vogesella sp. XCS3]
MKGVVFTEFLGLVEQKFSADMVDDIIDDADLPHGGAYTAVGTYPFPEMVALIVALSKRTGLAVPVLIHTFGQYLFGRFFVLYPAFINACDSTIELVSHIEQVIHTEVRKLYPDAELPSFEVESHTAQRLSVVYRSPRCLADLAVGLIDGAVAHYGEQGHLHLTREALDAEGTAVRFILEKT